MIWRMFLQNSFQKCGCSKIGVLISFPIFTRKYLCWSCKACNFNEKETSTQVSSCQYHKFFKSSYFRDHLRWLLLKMTEEFLRISNSSKICTEEFIKEKDLYRSSTIEDMKQRKLKLLQIQFFMQAVVSSWLDRGKTFSNQKTKLYLAGMITCDV